MCFFWPRPLSMPTSGRILAQMRVPRPLSMPTSGGVLAQMRVLCARIPTKFGWGIHLGISELVSSQLAQVWLHCRFGFTLVLVWLHTVVLVSHWFRFGFTRSFWFHTGFIVVSHRFRSGFTLPRWFHTGSEEVSDFAFSRQVRLGTLRTATRTLEHCGPLRLRSRC